MVDLTTHEFHGGRAIHNVMRHHFQQIVAGVEINSSSRMLSRAALHALVERTAVDNLHAVFLARAYHPLLALRNHPADFRGW